jgi:tetratricopeptide (TPR) repeat protein
MLILTMPPSVNAGDRATEALRLCESAEDLPRARKAMAFERGLELAEEAVARERDADAHFAVFCHLGKRMQLDGLSLRTLRDLPRLRRELDATLQLDPDYPDALIAKGALLLSLPRLLGGDRAAAERHLQRAVALTPANPYGHLYLARALAARGVRDEARAAAQKALAFAEQAGKQAQVQEAMMLLAALV